MKCEVRGSKSEVNDAPLGASSTALQTSDFELRTCPVRFTLDGSPAVPPAGVLASARSSGSDRVTWAPRGDLRFATVEIAVGDRVVIAGQSLQPNEARIDRLGPMLAAGWALTAVIGVVGVFVADVYRRRVAAGS